MKKTAILLAILALVTTSVFAQYSGPNSITFDPKTQNYYISNTVNGTITKLDAAYKTSTVITNLTEPKGLFFIDAGSNRLLIVLDQDKIKVFDPVSYSLIQTVAVTGATNLEDAVVDLGNPNVFYLSDRGGNKIIRGELGPPPFYVPSFSDLKTGIDRPTGLWFDDKGRLLLVQDTTDSPISSIDTSNGNITTLKSTNLDYLNSIIQDAQGNYFVTCWGDDNLYRFAPDFSDSVKINTFNNPSGFYFNKSVDLLIVACYNCNKLEFLKLHSFIPVDNPAGCPGDSITIYFNQAYKSVGTYGNSNQFFVDISDGQGNFSPPYLAGKLVSNVDPDPIRIKLPDVSYGTGNFKFRVRSTSPFILSPEYNLTIYSLPVAKASDYDKIGSCINASVQLGETQTTNYLYSWAPAANLNDSTLSDPTYSSSVTGEDTLYLTVTNALTGCSSMDTVIISTNPDLSLPQLNEIVPLCEGDSINIGVVNASYAFKWTPNFTLSSDTVSNPLAWPPSDLKYYVTFTDPGTGCSGNDSVVVLVNPKPITPNAQSEELCKGESTTISVVLDTNSTYSYTPTHFLSADTGNLMKFSADSTGEFMYLVTATNSFNCSSSAQFTMTVHPLPTPVITSLTYVQDPAEDSLILIWNDTSTSSTGTLYAKDSFTAVTELANMLPQGRVALPVSLFSSFWKQNRLSFEYMILAKDTLFYCENDNGSYLSFLYTQVSVQDLNTIAFSVYPNPASYSISISGIKHPVNEVVIINSIGKMVLLFDQDSNWDVLDVSSLAPGIYSLILTDSEGKRGVQKVVIQ